MYILIIAISAMIVSNVNAQLYRAVDLVALSSSLAQAEASTSVIQSTASAITPTIDTASSTVQSAIAQSLYATVSTSFQPASSRMTRLEALVADISIASTSRLPTLAASIQSEVSQRIAKITANRLSGNIVSDASGAAAGINAGISGTQCTNYIENDCYSATY
jgi:hypothetical protein